MSPSAPASTSEDRASARYQIELEVSLQSDSNFYMGLTQNLSTGGLFVATHLVQPIGTSVEIALSLSTLESPLALHGRVRWIREFSERLEAEPGMGIEFDAISEADARAITDFLATRTPLFFDMT